MPRPQKDAHSVERALDEFIYRCGISDTLTVAMVKNWIWRENDPNPLRAVHDYQQKAVSYFESVEDVDLNELLAVFSDAWNYFPHKSLDGKSPEEMAGG